MANGWTLERRARQADLIRHNGDRGKSQRDRRQGPVRGQYLKTHTKAAPGCCYANCRVLYGNRTGNWPGMTRYDSY